MLGFFSIFNFYFNFPHNTENETFVSEFFLIGGSINTFFVK